MLDVTFPTNLSFILRLFPFSAIPSLILIPQVLQFLSAATKASFPIKFSFSRSTNFPRPTENGFVFLSKSCPADKSPASIRLPLNEGVAVNIIPIFFPSSKIKSPINSALFSGLK